MPYLRRLERIRFSQLIKPSQTYYQIDLDLHSNPEFQVEKIEAKLSVATQNNKNNIFVNYAINDT